jgi:hypothetical protein
VEQRIANPGATTGATALAGENDIRQRPWA